MFNIYQTILNEHGWVDFDRYDAYADGLMGEFEASAEGKGLAQAGGDLGWVDMILRYGVDYLGVTPGDMSVADVREVLFELIPAKVSTPADGAVEIVTSLRAFWSFVDRQYALPAAREILATLNDHAVLRLKKQLADPGNWGFAKSFAMAGMEAGYDMTTQEGLDAFVKVFNRSLPSAGLAPSLRWGGESLWRRPEEPDSIRESRRKARKKQRQARKKSRK